MSPLSLDSQRLIVGVMITVTGELDITNAAQLETYVRRQMLPREAVVLDLAGLTFMDSSGLDVLLRLHAALRHHGSDLHVTAVHGMPARILQITGIDEALNLHSSVEQAIVSLLSRQAVRPAEPA
jgi:anti-anti-sigma factor